METSLNPVQKKSLSLISADARLIHSILKIPNKPNSNYICMFLPYLGIFTHGAEQWDKKVKLNTPTFSGAEKSYYIAMRSAMKIFDTSFDELCALLGTALHKSEVHFFKIRTFLSKILNFHYNVGCDLHNNSYLGNTILCSLFTPFFDFDKDKYDYGEYVKNTSIIAGKLAATYRGLRFPNYCINSSMNFKYEDYNFFEKCPLKNNTIEDFALFSILCNINFIRIFIGQFFIEEFPSKLRLAYLQYFYLTKLIPEINLRLSTDFSLDLSLKNDKFRNCMAHYGLGVCMVESDIVEEDLMFGLTIRLMDKSYFEVKDAIFHELDTLAHQLESYLL